MREIVIPPSRPLFLRIVDRTAEATLLLCIPALAVLAIGVQIGG